MPSMTKTALYVMISSVVISAVLGIIAILSGNWGWYEFRILLTTITISGASICILACVALWERKNIKPLPISGIILSLIGAILMIWGIWAESLDDVFWKLTVSIIIFAIATSHLSLLSLARLSEKYIWALWLAYLAIYGLATTITWMIIDENTSTGAFQFVGVVSILVGSVSILIPIFQRFSASISEEPQLETAVKTVCPYCGNEQMIILGEITCERCQSLFVVKILRAGKIE